MTDQAGCWSGLRVLFKRSKAARVETRAKIPASNAPYEAPPTYGSERTNKPGLYQYHGSYCDWSTLGQGKVIDECVKELELPFPEAADTSDNAIHELNSVLREANLKIHDHPELGWEVNYAHDVLTDLLEEHGFTITRHYLADQLSGNTAWKGEFTIMPENEESLSVVGFNSEMDALPGIGHACGHNLIAVVGVAAALGLKCAMEKHKVPGKIIILGTPAEEKGSGKAEMLEAGAYKEMDVCLMAHPKPGTGGSPAVGIGSSLALQSFTVEYHGQTAHAGAAPWEGRNALDAAFIAYAAISALRQQLHPTMRVHGIIEGHDWAPNVIPNYAKMTYFVRAQSWEQTIDLRSRVNKCFEAAAHATSCTMKMEGSQKGVKDLKQNYVLAEDFAAVMTARHKRAFISESTSASTDFGNVTYELPALHPGFSIPTVVGGGNHTPAFTAAARTEEAHENAMAVSKGLATVGLRILLDKTFRQAAKDSYKKQFPQRFDQASHQSAGSYAF